MSEEKVFVFHAQDARFAGAVFESVEKASEWIAKYELTGLLTAYPLNKGVYDWAVEQKYFDPKQEKHKTSKFIGGFTSASQEHYHFENGKNA